MPHLTEESLGKSLKTIFNAEFTRDRTVPNSGIASRPDFRNDDLMLIVEFDGFRHFNCAKVIIADNKKDAIYQNMGYRIVRIPYFVQLDSVTIKHFFNIDVQWDLEFPHGFISDKALLPADFNALGILKYENIMLALPEYVRISIESSLKYKASSTNYLEVFYKELSLSF